MCDDIKVDRMLKVFCEVQENKPSLSDNLKWLQDYYDEIGFDIFKEQFLHVLLLLQLHADYKTINPYYDNIFEFWTKFLKRFEGKKNELKLFLLEGFLEYVDHSNDTLRFRICQSILAILTIEADFIEMLPGDIIENLRESMLVRVKDTILLIKLQAIEIIKFVQDVDDSDDPVIKALIVNLTNVNIKVRLAAMNAIAPVSGTIQSLIDRIRDVNEKVRHAACKKFTYIPVQNLTIVQRHTLLRNGLKDFSESVRTCIEQELLPWWLKCYNNSYMGLMNALLLDGTDQEIKLTKELTEKVLKVLFRSQPVVHMLEQIKLNDKLILEEELSLSYAMYWKCLIQHFIDVPEGHQYLDQLLPATKDFCEYLLKYYTTNKEKSLSIWEYGNYQRTLEELVHLAVLCDISDECNRLAHHQTMLQLLRGDISTGIIAAIFIYINQILPDVNRRINFVCEFVSDIRNTCDSNVSAQDYADYEEKTNSIRKQINKLLDDQRKAVEQLNLQHADVLKKEIENLKTQLKELNDKMSSEEQPVRNNDPEVILKCTNIVIELLQSPDIIKPNGALKTLQEELVKDLVFVNDTAIQSRIMLCYAILCSFNKDSATACVTLFAPILLSYGDMSSDLEERILVTVINSLTDMMLVWGEKAFPCAVPDHETSLEEMFSHISYKETIQIFISMMEDKNEVVREASGVAIMKLLDMNRLQSPLLLSRLILKWFNPITAEKDMRLYQYLGVFLVNFNLESHAGAQYVDAFVPSVVAVTSAPVTSPLSSISMDKLVKFLAHVTSPTTTSNPHLHKTLARTLSRAMESDTYNIKCNLVYAKTLALLDIFNSDEDFIQSMIDSCEDLISEIEDGINSITLKRSIQKVLHQLKFSSSVKSGNDTLSEEEEATCKSP